jgi:hypothetical protein
VKYKNSTTDRDLNIELLRLVLMLMIICHHIFVHARGLSALSLPNFKVQENTIQDAFVNSFLIMPVNCFVFISGYYGMKFRSKTVLSLLVQTSFYAFFLSFLFDAFNGHLSIKTLFNGLFPILRGQWWFITAYFFLYLLSPLLNLAKLNFNKFQFLYILAVLVAINFFSSFFFKVNSLGISNGYSLLSFVCIYFLGFAFKENINYKQGTIFYILIYIISSLCLFGIFKFVLGNYGPQSAWYIWSYNNPLVMVSAISFFFIFKNLEIKKNVLLRLSSYVLGIYLIHDFKQVRGNLDNILNYVINTFKIGNDYIAILILAIVIFVIAILIEVLRVKLTDPVIKWLTIRLRLESLDEKINKLHS